MMDAVQEEKERLYREELMRPFAFKWACVGLHLKAETDGAPDVVSAAPMSGCYAPAQITQARRAEVDSISSDAFWADCERSIRDALEDFARYGVALPTQDYVFTVLLSDPRSP